MLRPSGSIVLPFKIKKASLALRIESLIEKTFSMGISCMSLAVWLGEDQEMLRNCGRFRFSVRVIYGTAVFIIKRRLVSPMYCKLQRLH